MKDLKEWSSKYSFQGTHMKEHLMTGMAKSMDSASGYLQIKRAFNRASGRKTNYWLRSTSESLFPVKTNKIKTLT